jgi:hypothetical protein
MMEDLMLFSRSPVHGAVVMEKCGAAIEACPTFSTMDIEIAEGSNMNNGCRQWHEVYVARAVGDT